MTCPDPLRHDCDAKLIAQAVEHLDEFSDLGLVAGIDAMRLALLGRRLELAQALTSNAMLREALEGLLDPPHGPDCTKLLHRPGWFYNCNCRHMSKAKTAARAALASTAKAGI